MDIRQRIFEIENEDDFGQVALDVFRFQAEHSSVYKQYISYLGLSAGDVTHYRDIPFLPIQFFKTQEVIVSDHDTELSFHSSGTTGMQASRHLVHDLSWYEESYRKAFELFYGDVSGMAILALLPSYLEREGSSLIYMITSDYMTR
jgi:phenylacetate-coenzyme A ligase PaaK-like adenylate-forming protein